MNLLQMSVSAGLMIFVVTMIRTLVINRLPKKTFLVLWGIVLLRLLVPFKWPSQFSFYSLVNPQGMAVQIGGAPSAAILPIVPGADSFTAASAAGRSLWIWIWGAGTALCTLYFAAVYISCRREFRASRPAEHPFTAQWLAEYKCKRPITIRQSAGIFAPLTYGIFRPVILMPAETDWTEDTKKLQYILAHEYVHIRRFDGATKLLLTAAFCIHWFNPMVWAMYTLANRDIELSCDEKVVRMFGETIKSAYALALISMEETRNRFTPLCSNFSKNVIEERIRAIMKIKKTTITAIALSICMVGGVTAIFATSASANSDGSGISVETGTVMSRKLNDDSPYQYSINNGATWMSESDYNAMLPQDKIVWWTYDDYKKWLEEERPILQSYVGSDAKYMDKNGQWTGWTQEHVNETIKMYEGILESIRNGAKVSKTINGDDSIGMITTPPAEGQIGVSYGGSVADETGQTVDLGDFASKEQLMAAAKQYCEEQVKAGRMSQEEADRFLIGYNDLGGDSRK